MRFLITNPTATYHSAMDAVIDRPSVLDTSRTASHFHKYR
jgi:hypothetical protein